MAEPEVIEADARAGDWRIGVVASRYNRQVVERLIAGCLRTLIGRGIRADRITIVRVPGAFEIPLAAKALADRRVADAIVTLGAIVRGETRHFDFIAAECARGVAGVATAAGVPVSFGVLTVDTIDQALDRSGDDESNKGSEAAAAALEMIGILRKLAP
ncbi:MAG: 6,7-dimethyl-8-ribityllumazine synthase [Gammaproteobacteria bacterium]|nr:6,7-dimethyl-8-ribityllumazine synthase [Gammaproteobacteria bacterium]